MFIAVGTPSRRGDGHADLSYVYAATAGNRGRSLSGFTVVITKSTVPVGHRRRSGKTYPRNQPVGRCCRRLESRNFCVRARRSATSSFLTASWSVPTTNGPAKLSPKFTGRFT